MCVSDSVVNIWEYQSLQEVHKKSINGTEALNLIRKKDVGDTQKKEK